MNRKNDKHNGENIFRSIKDNYSAVLLSRFPLHWI